VSTSPALESFLPPLSLHCRFVPLASHFPALPSTRLRRRPLNCGSVPRLCRHTGIVNLLFRLLIYSPQSHSSSMDVDLPRPTSCTPMRCHHDRTPCPLTLQFLLISRIYFTHTSHCPPTTPYNAIVKTWRLIIAISRPPHPPRISPNVTFYLLPASMTVLSPTDDMALGGHVTKSGFISVDIVCLPSI